MYGLIPFARETSLGRVYRDFDDLISRVFGEVELPTVWEGKEFVPAVDLKETDKGYELSAEVPGLKPEEIEVSLHGDVLVITGEKKNERIEDKEGYHLEERTYGSFYRSFRLPEEVDSEKLEAVHKDGVLRVTLPKCEKPVPKEIEVKKG
ncbi:MAG: Hsp20/alpha crystallin family protein [Desulfarculus sp.]|jgi:HSP20 family protein|nr:MAG: Hsp20/alpha crystallin family protein [Desulfarculus sp.]